ncbi:relaxase domain-containing protein [Gluconacetobacter diazotrophicus]|uniref:Relaxase domain-containing protein n=1 Tax=Gluconacetobacter diazotrophicus TaxID=33996 RepID=A0A7W4I5K8_GLUDI|nr:MobF family relaxase [Gluconacetobacter diazotrophicus]MBB2156605.1 relaxase domain-containing protein [Gluconacetobacter diazotrophicus]
MITYRKITAEGAGKLLLAYLREHNLAPDHDVRVDKNKARDVESGARLNSYYTGREGRGAWAPEIGERIASALGIDVAKPPKDQGIINLLECKRADTGEKWAGDHANRKLSGFDFTSAPHKSVTLAAEFAATSEEQALIWQAIHMANDQAMALIAKEVGIARRGKGGTGLVEAGEVAWISFRHYTARPALHIQDGPGGATASVEVPVPGDPQAHIHNVMFNAVATESGHLGSLDSKRITKATSHLYGAYFQAHLASLLRDLGIEVHPDERGKAVVIKDIPKNVCEAFSKRSRQAEQQAKAFVKRQGGDWSTLSADQKFKILHQANLAYRSKKYDGTNDREIWREEAAELGWKHETVLTDAKARALTDTERFEMAYEIAARLLADEFRTAAVLDRDVFRTHAAHGLIASGIRAAEDVDQVVELIMARGIMVEGSHAYFIEEEQDGRARLTTTEQVALEKELARLAGLSARTKQGMLTDRQIAEAIKASGLDFERDPDHGRAQKAAIWAMGSAGGMALTIGAAGSGKTALLTPLVSAWQGDGREVVGAAMAWRQADALKDAGIERTFAIATLLRGIEDGSVGLTSKSVLVIDEISQVAPRQLLKILQYQQQVGFALRTLGDREQAQAIEAGDSVEILNRVLPQEAQPQITGTIRQKTAHARRIATMFRSEGRDLSRSEDEQRAADVQRARMAIDLKRKDGMLSLVGGDHQQVVDEIADLYIRRRDLLRAAGATRGITMSAPTNTDVMDLSLAVRVRLRERGEIGAEEIIRPAIDQRGETFDLPISRGDRVRLFARTSCQIDTSHGKRWKSLGSNGDFVDVEGWNDKGIVLRNRSGTSGTVPWTALADNRTGRIRLGSGHAMTIDSAQGITSDEHINAMPRGSSAMTGFTAYVAESRHVHRCFTRVAEAPLREAEAFSRALGDKAPVTIDDLYNRLASDMGRHPYKALGIDLVKERLTHEKQTSRWIRQNHDNEQASREGQTPGEGWRRDHEEKPLRDVTQRHWDDIDRRLRRAGYSMQRSMEQIRRQQSNHESPVPSTGHPGRPQRRPQAGVASGHDTDR